MRAHYVVVIHVAPALTPAETNGTFDAIQNARYYLVAIYYYRVRSCANRKIAIGRARNGSRGFITARADCSFTGD